MNRFGQPVGAALPGWTPRAAPPRTPMRGRYCIVEPVAVERDAAALWDAFAEAPDARDWTYLPTEPPADGGAYRDWLTEVAARPDPFFHTIREAAGGRPLGVASFMRIDPPNGVIEVGHINFSRRLQRTPAATEAIFLMAARAFDELGYRRFEWKCDALNAPSRRAAERFGFVFEGVFRQAVVTKGRNRDTAWYSIVDQEWPRVKAGFEAWLAPENFDADGRQRRPLAACRAAAPA